MHTDMLIHKTSGQKVYNIEKHYELATIEFNSVEMCVAEQKNASAMKKPLAKKDVSAANKMIPIVAKDDASTEEKEGYDAKKDAPILKKPHTDFVLAAMSAASGEEVLMNHEELYATVSDSDWMKSAPDNLE
jgi:hypothetical protein